MAKPPYDRRIAIRLLKVLLEHPEGIWLSKLAKESRVAVSTTSHYLDHHLSALVEETRIGEEKSVIRIVRLKSQIYEKCCKSSNPIRDLLRTIDIIKNYRSSV